MVQLQQPPERYTRTAIALHWVVALAIAAQLVIGFLMLGQTPVIDTGMSLYNPHKVLGITILWLVTVRILWRLAHCAPAQTTLQRWEAKLASIVHALLYIFMLAMPLSGWIMSSAQPQPHPIDFFGLFDWPLLPIAGNEAAGNAAAFVHNNGAWVLLGLITLHIAGTLKHLVLDRINILARMGVRVG